MRASQIALSAIVAVYVTSAVAQSSPPATLKEQLDTIARGTTGTLGYSLHHLKTGERLDRLGDELFPTDSTLKVAIMAAAMERVASGNQPYGALRTWPLMTGTRADSSTSSETARRSNSGKPFIR